MTKQEGTCKEPEADDSSEEQFFEDGNDSSFSSAVYSERELGDSQETPVKARGRPSTLYHFKHDHPLYDSHGTRFISNNSHCS